MGILNIIAAVIANMVIGWVWYGPLFGGTWAKIIGVGIDAKKNDPEARKRMTPVIATNLFLSLVSIFTFAVARQLVGAISIGASVQLGLLICIGFILPVEGGFALWSGKHKKLAWEMFLVSSGYQLLAFAVAGVILAL